MAPRCPSCSTLLKHCLVALVSSRSLGAGEILPTSTSFYFRPDPALAWCTSYRTMNLVPSFVLLGVCIKQGKYFHALPFQLWVSISLSAHGSLSREYIFPRSAMKWCTIPDHCISLHVILEIVLPACTSPQKYFHTSAVLTTNPAGPCSRVGYWIRLARQLYQY